MSKPLFKCMQEFSEAGYNFVLTLMYSLKVDCLCDLLTRLLNRLKSK